MRVVINSLSCASSFHTVFPVRVIIFHPGINCTVLILFYTSPVLVIHNHSKIIFWPQNKIQFCLIYIQIATILIFSFHFYCRPVLNLHKSYKGNGSGDVRKTFFGVVNKVNMSKLSACLHWSQFVVLNIDIEASNK